MKPITPEQERAFRTYLIYEGTSPRSDYVGTHNWFWTLGAFVRYMRDIFK